MHDAKLIIERRANFCCKLVELRILRVAIQSLLGPLQRVTRSLLRQIDSCDSALNVLMRYGLHHRVGIAQCARGLKSAAPNSEAKIACVDLLAGCTAVLSELGIGIKAERELAVARRHGKEELGRVYELAGRQTHVVVNRCRSKDEAERTPR